MTQRPPRYTSHGLENDSCAPDLRTVNEAPNSPLRDDLVVLRLGTIILGAEDADRAAAFWADVLGYEVIRFPGSSDGFTILVPPDRVGTRIAVHRSTTPVQERPRVHLDLVVDSPSEQSSEVDRLVELGATRVPWEYSGRC